MMARMVFLPPLEPFRLRSSRIPFASPDKEACMLRPLRALSLAFGLAFIAFATGCSRNDSAPAATASLPPLVTVGKVVQVEWQDEIQALGTAQANESVTLTAKVTETVTRVNFQDGDFVEAGAVLVDLSGRAEVAQLEAAQATFVEARQQYERLAELVKQGTIPRSQLDTQLSMRDAARARADAIRAALADRSSRSWPTSCRPSSATVPA